MIMMKMYYFINLIIISHLLLLSKITYCTTNDNVNDDDDKSTKPFIKAENVVNATLGKNVVLTCEVYNVKNYKIAWYHETTLLTLDTIRIYDDDRYTIENTKLNEWKLIINSIDLNDEGHYSCRLSNGLKKLIHLKVGVPPKFTTTNDDSTHQVYLNVNEYENLTLSCEASGNPMPVIHWYKKNKHISTGVNLHIKNLTRQHTHYEYECVARNNVPPDASRHFKININFEPIVNLMYHFQTYLNVQNMDILIDADTDATVKISNNKEDESIDSNVISDDRSSSSVRNLEFVCEIYGNPVNSISWIKDGIKLKEITNFVNFNYINPYDKSKSKMLSITTNEIKTYKYLTRLQIKNVDEKDNGIYECIVNSLNGNTSKSVNVNDIKPIEINTPSSSLMMHKNTNKKHKHKTTTAITKNDGNNNNNIIELNVDDDEASKSSLVFDIHQKENENSIENSYENNNYNAFRGPRSNSTNNRFYYADNKASKTTTTLKSLYFTILSFSFSLIFCN